jgi:transposase
MGTVRTDEFRKDAVRIARSSKDQKTARGTVFPGDGRSHKQIADHLGGGMSTLNTWITAHPLPGNRFSRQPPLPHRDGCSLC